MRRGLSPRGQVRLEIRSIVEGVRLEKFKKILSNLPHPVRWGLTMLVGFTLLILGLIMLVTPGPGILFLFFGLSILALEIEWARELNKQGMQGLEIIVSKIKGFLKIGKKPKP